MSKTDNAVTNFFGKCMADPEIDKKQFIEAIAVGLGSTIGLYINEYERAEVLEQTVKMVDMGCAVTREVKPVADILRTGIPPGVHVFVIQGNKK